MAAGNEREKICHRCGYRPAQPGEGVCPHDGSFLVDEREHQKHPDDPLLGTVVGGKFPLLGILGVGGMGAIYRSEQLPPLVRTVAVKVVLEEGAEPNEVAQQRFLREAEAIARLNHRSVVTLFEYGAEPSGLQYMVLEYVSGKTLHKVLRKGGLTASKVVAIGLEVLDALAAAHARQIIHRDITPGNLMLVDEEAGPAAAGPQQVKVLDFGLARIVGDATRRLTRKGTVVGTPQYMSPEQVTGDSLDPRTDLYSLAAVLYECLAGRPPFQAREPVQLLMRLVREEAPPLPELPYIPAGLGTVLCKGLARRRDLRYATAQAMAEALRGVVLGPAADRPIPPQDPPDPRTEDGESLADDWQPATAPMAVGRLQSAQPEAPTPAPHDPRSDLSAAFTVQLALAEADERHPARSEPADDGHQADSDSLKADDDNVETDAPVPRPPRSPRTWPWIVLSCASILVLLASLALLLRFFWPAPSVPGVDAGTAARFSPPGPAGDEDAGGVVSGKWAGEVVRTAEPSPGSAADAGAAQPAASTSRTASPAIASEEPSRAAYAGSESAPVGAGRLTPSRQPAANARAEAEASAMPLGQPRAALRAAGPRRQQPLVKPPAAQGAGQTEPVLPPKMQEESPAPPPPVQLETPGRLQVFSASQGIQVYVDGKMLGSTPMGPIQLPAGYHSLMLAQPGAGILQSRQVLVPAGGVARVRAEDER